uniref:Meta-cleavage compound hydrolase n=1 Tax=Neptuniibacter sp. CAR-SF TaxID=197651 RepID=B2DD14_9GAMM|nr:meta-cleavage compound hydrolase [Neptuniibacter sp. CAR-SF]
MLNNQKLGDSRSQDYSEKFVNAGGVRTRYLEAGSGKPIILIHGGGAGAESEGNWKNVIPYLAKEYRVIAMDMIGFGKTDKPDLLYSQDLRIKHLVDFVEVMGFDQKVSLIGNSMGGATALGVSVERKDLVDSLVLMGSAGLVTELHDDLKPIVNYDFTRKGMINLIKALTNSSFEIEEKMVNTRFDFATDHETRKSYAATMQWIRDQGGLYYDDDYIRQLKIPTLVVQGKDDKVVPISTAYKFLELITNSWGYFIPHCGHWAMIEHPTDFSKATMSFLSQHK